MKDLFPHYSIGHFIGEPDNPTEFEITRFEEMGDLEDIEDPHKHTFYEILWFDEGVSTQTIDYREYKIEPKTLFFISPNQLHHFEEWQPLKGGSIFFTEDFFLLNQQNKDKLFELAFLDNFHAQPFFKPDALTYQQIKQTIELIYTEKKRPDFSITIIQSLLNILLTQIQRGVEQETKTMISKSQIVLYKKFRELLNLYFKTGKKASDYAKMLHVTPHHLNLIAKKITAKTTTQLIRERSILEAKRLLTFSQNSISEIANELGYFDLSYFAKVFKQQTQVSPVQFRKTMSEKYRNL